MAEATTYKCPQCSATLRPPNPVPAGKKIKCPKCQNIFAPTAEQPKATASKPAGAAKPKLDDDEDGGAYALKDEPAPPEPVKRSLVPPDDDEDDAPRKKKKKARDDDEEQASTINQRGPVRKKGPAQAICQAPSNKMLGTSSLTCASCVVSLVVCLWPLVFTKARSWYTGFLGFDLPIMVLLPLLVGAFLYNGTIALGAVKMQSVESYSMAMLASTMTVIPASWALAVPAYFWFYKFIGAILVEDLMMPMATMACISAWYVYVGMWNMKTLRDPAVIEGFEEKSPEYGD